ncbi:MAG TPA: glycosyltransferase, partial [Alphaproteobacteria bacterium]|nr:glycosyltransferase [Alphaproteobacteria bacterium]
MEIKKPFLSIIIPVFYNELNITPLYQKLKEHILDNKDIDYELIFVDDGSKDNSYAELEKLHNINSKVKLVKLSKNFGSYTAILAGLNYAKGDCATAISADLQDSPQIIINMMEKWQQGNKVVLAVRKDREESGLQKLISNTHYKLMRKFALPNMPKGGFDCFLIDRKVIDILTAMEEKNTALIGQILWCGFKMDMIYYVRQKREIGKSRWTLSKKIKYFIDSFLSFSYFPIRAMSVVGILTSLFGFCYGGIVIFNKLFNDTVVTGWSSMM